MSKYMAVLIISLSLPFLLSFWPPLKFWRNLKALILTLALIVVIFGAWDVFAVWRGHWSFGAGGIYGIKIINLPVEEWLFFIVVPFCCIFTWEALRFIRRKMQ